MDKRLFIILRLVRTLAESRRKAAEAESDDARLEKYTLLITVIDIAADVLSDGE